MGYHRAGFDVVGVDIAPQPRYPFPFRQGDALACLERIRDGVWAWWADRPFDAIHASPPCQAYSVCSDHTPGRHPDLYGPTRDLLESIGIPWCIENVRGAPTRTGVVLCGGMFGMGIRRHRNFETSLMLMVPPHACPRNPWDVTGNAGGHKRTSRRSINKYWDLAHAKELMGMDWPEKVREVTEAVPPAYTEWIGAQLLERLRMVA
jgi:DNA (cytosine-5)-methyltransferase 1